MTGPPALADLRLQPGDDINLVVAVVKAGSMVEAPPLGAYHTFTRAEMG